MRDNAVEAAEVFISYSSEDRDRIQPIVELVRAMKNGSVFQDFASIRPGRLWEGEIMEALRRCRTLLVFWCTHSAASDWVCREYEAGIAAAKEIIPLRLDDTALPDALARYQGLDFRRQEPHGGLAAFIPLAYRRSNRHYRAKDEHGEYRDWDHEEHESQEHSRFLAWERLQRARTEEIARALAARLTGR